MRNEPTTMRARLWIHPSARSCRMPASTSGMPGAARPPRPRRSRRRGPARAGRRRRLAEVRPGQARIGGEELTVEVTPRDLADELLGRRAVGDLVRADAAEAQVRRQPRRGVRRQVVADARRSAGRVPRARPRGRRGRPTRPPRAAGASRRPRPGCRGPDPGRRHAERGPPPAAQDGPARGPPPRAVERREDRVRVLAGRHDLARFHHRVAGVDLELDPRRPAAVGELPFPRRATSPRPR